MLWERHEGARGGRLRPGLGASGVGRSPTPDCPPSGRAARAHYPLAVGAGGAGLGTRHQPHSARSCELSLRAVGAGQGRPGGAPPAWVWVVRGRALSHPRLPALWAAAGAHYPPAVGAGGGGCWDPSPTPQRALLRAGFARCRSGMGVPGGGASCPGVGRPGSGALPTPTARPLGGLPGPTTRWLWVRGGAGVGTCHKTPQRALLRAGFARCGGGMRVPGGGASCLGVRRPGSGAPPPRLPALWAGCRGPLPTGCGCRGVRVWGPVTNPTARALASWLCALWGRHEGARRGRLLPGCGASGVGSSPIPTARPLGGLPGPTTHWLWVRGGARVGTRHQPHSARSRQLALRAVGAA